jgi:hypothetical protein
MEAFYSASELLSALETKCTYFPVPSRDALTRLSQAGNNKENLVSVITAGDGKIANLFLQR